MKKNQWFIIFIAIICVGIASPIIYDEITGGVHEGNITHTFPIDPKWHIAQPSDEQILWAKNVLDQPYTWLNQGHQVFAFISTDKKYVLKVFKFKRLNPLWLTPYLSQIPLINSYYIHQEKKRLSRIEKLFRGYHTAYTQDRTHTGILFLHLDHQQVFNQKVTVTDKAGLLHELEIGSCVFAIQECGTKTKDVLKSFLNKGDTANVKSYIRKLFDLYVSEYNRG